MPDQVIPDSIEPVRGFKALSVIGDFSLSSPSQSALWPKRKRMEAQCTSGLSHWAWVPVEGEPRELDATTTLAPLMVRAPNVVAVTAVVSSSAIGMPVIPQTPPKPNNPLPPGWSWSWEALTHDAPAEDCSCGIYVADTPEATLSYLHQNGVIAEIALWGKVIPGTSGARGQYAYVTRLLTPVQIVDEIRPVSEAYGAPMLILEEEREKLAETEAEQDALQAMINSLQKAT